MYCGNCKNELSDNDKVCTNCGIEVGKGIKFCKFCGDEVKGNAKFCVKCGKLLDINNTEKKSNNYTDTKYNNTFNEDKNKKIYCRNCSSEMSKDAIVCVKCGVKKGKGNNYCGFCGGKTNENAAICVSCGASLKNNKIDNLIGVNSKSKLIAVLLCVFLGTLGIHRFYVGDNSTGFVLLALTLGGFLTCGITTFISFIWVVVDLILIIIDKITDENGVPLEW